MSGSILTDCLRLQGTPSAASSPSRGGDSPERGGSGGGGGGGGGLGGGGGGGGQPVVDSRMSDRNLALTVELQQTKLKNKREKLDLVKKLEASYMESRGLKQARTEMQGEVGAETPFPQLFAISFARLRLFSGPF